MVSANNKPRENRVQRSQDFALINPYKRDKGFLTHLSAVFTNPRLIRRKKIRKKIGKSRGTRQIMKSSNERLAEKLLRLQENKKEN